MDYEVRTAHVRVNYWVWEHDGNQNISFKDEDVPKFFLGNPESCRVLKVPMRDFWDASFDPMDFYLKQKARDAETIKELTGRASNG